MKLYMKDERFFNNEPTNLDQRQEGVKFFHYALHAKHQQLMYQLSYIPALVS